MIWSSAVLALQLLATCDASPLIQHDGWNENNDNVYYLANCKLDSKIMYYSDIKISYTDEHRAQTTTDQYRPPFPGGWEGKTILAWGPNPTSRNFNVTIFSRTWTKDKNVGALAGHATDWSGGSWDCFQDNGRWLYKDPEDCSAQYICGRAGVALAPHPMPSS
ncbi:hypothetical protein BU16DRAFT_539736 [Lophium mytilinum]|uniref:Uncharacterized protein n=1 Tax=Lophium mytilinum TaxID=390894 RepID=A0A6A6QR14_9PEZI|nr:hypothetical protein BU16DRAFT_539736 [Lophium mytilinum]